MKEFKFLKFLDLFQPLFHKLGIEYAIMRRILQIKLVMDGRRVPTILNTKNSAEESDNNFFKSLGLYLLMGLILIPFVWMKQDYIYQMSIVFTIIIFFIMTSLISDFSAVLLDIKDKNIIGTKPIAPKTLHFAKIIHISYYMFTITAALVSPALIACIYRQGILFFLLFLLSIIFLDLLIIVLTAFLYLFILRFFDGEKLKDIINYIQIILTIVITVGYQVFVRLFDIMSLDVQFVPRWWQFLMVPIWFSAPFQMLQKAEVNNTYLLFTFMAIVIPLIAFVVYIRSMPLFETYLQKLSNNSGTRKKVVKKGSPLLPKLLCRSKEERVFYRFASDMMRNEREFKLKVYPSLGFAIVFPYIFLFQQASEYGFNGISQGKFYFFIYLSGIMLPTVMWMIRYSSNYKGAWIYRTVPISQVAPIFKGTIKALIVRLFLPLFLLQAIIFLAIFGIGILPDLLIVFINIMIFNVLCFMSNKKSLPFSEAFQSTQQMNGLITFLLILGLGVLALFHYIASRAAYGIYIYLALAVMILMILWNSAFQISQKNLNNF